MTRAARPPEEPAPERRFMRYAPVAEPGRDEVDDPEEETIFAGLRTLQTWELALFLGSIIVSLLIWLIFIWVHRGTPTS
ncbi:MAG: hypothetical protein ACR2NO_06705 [Chloroflexota bacterium]